MLLIYNNPGDIDAIHTGAPHGSLDHQAWLPHERPRAAIVLTHGIGTTAKAMPRSPRASQPSATRLTLSISAGTTSGRYEGLVN